MSSTVIVPLADRLIQIASTLGVNGVKGYRWPPKELAKLPALVIELPHVERTPVDEPEDHLGQKDWTVTFPSVFYFELTKAGPSQDLAVEIVEAFVLAIDADQSLGGLCQEAKAVEVEIPEYVEDEAKPVIRWPIRVQILKFV